MTRTLIIAAAVLATLIMPSAARAAGIGAGNWVWYYQHVQPADAAKFAGARAVVVSDQTDDAAAIAEIHAQGALAFHYVNVYWYPANRAYEGVDLSQDATMAFCTAGTQPAVGRTRSGVPWDYADLNERGLHDSVVTYLRSLRSAGYDGVFFDLGTVALAVGPMPDKVSTCTGQPVAAGATFADAYSGIVKAAAGVGLRVALNYTTRKPLRADVAAVVDRTLYENAPGTTLATFASSFARRRAEDAAVAHGAPRYVEEIKTTRLGDRPAAFFGWAQAALWRVDMTINTGDDACGGGAVPDCARFGTFPELTAVRRGKAMDAAPSSRSCTARSTIKCLWVRRWQYALVMVNTTASPIRATVSTGHRRCRVFTDVWRHRVLHKAACTLKLTVTVPAESGRVYPERLP
jgi:hypothetical protein